VFFASVHFSYRRYLENRLRDAFGYRGTPIRLVFRDRASVQLPKRAGRKAGGKARGSSGGTAAGKPGGRTTKAKAPGSSGGTPAGKPGGGTPKAKAPRSGSRGRRGTG
jgi:hypothetical protein